MDSGEWRPGQAEPERTWPSYANQSPGAPPNLWVDDPMVAWGSTDVWAPRQRTGEDQRRDAELPPPMVLEPDAWYRPAPPRNDPPVDAHPAPRHDLRVDLTEARAGVRTQTSQLERRAAAAREDTERWPRDTFDDPAYGPVLGFPAGW